MSKLFLSCEHAGNEVPTELRSFFAGHEDVLHTHRGLDIGALDLLLALRPLAAQSAYTTLSRLCIDMNRSEGHPQLFSSFMSGLAPRQRQMLLQRYRDHRSRFTARMSKAIAEGGDVLHIAVHSFTPVLNGVERRMDIGLLYDPSRAHERSFCHTWRKAILQRMPEVVVRMNQPYKGIADGFPTALRKVFPAHYAGIELEVNQRSAHGGRMDKGLKATLSETLKASIG